MNALVVALLLIENDFVRAELDPQTGALVSLSNPETGWSIQGRPELAQSFVLNVPLPDRLYHRVEGRKQKAPRVRRMDDAIELVWDRLDTEHAGTLDIRVTATISAEATGLGFRMKIENESPYVVESAAYPYIGDLTRPDEGPLTRADAFHNGLNTTSLYPTFRNERGYWGTAFPIQMTPAPEAPFLLVMGEKEGLYTGCHDESAWERVEFTFQLKPGYSKPGFVPAGAEIGGQPVHIEFFAGHLPFVQPGETRDLSPIILAPYAGSWHKGADVYGAWRKTWLRRPAAPDWLNKVHSWQMIQMNSWGDTLLFPYEDLVKRGEECARHGVGAIQLIGWTLSGQDGRLPIHDTDPRLGTREDFRRAVEQVQAMGVKVVLYQKYTCADVGTDRYRDQLHRYVSRDIFGNRHGHGGWQYDTPAHLAGINTRPLDWMCMNCADWRRHAIEEIRRTLEFKPAGVFLDECQWHGANAFYCFDSSHGHRVPAYNFAGDALFEAEMRELFRREAPDIVLGGEGCYDLQLRAYDLVYARVGEGHIPVMRYLDPFLPMMNWVYGYDDREALNLCLLYRYIISYEPRNFRGRLEEFPLTLEYGKKIDALRKRYSAYLWDAEFRDTLGASVSVDGQPRRLYSVFRHAESGKRALAIANHNETIPIEAVATFDPPAGPLRRVSPEEPDPVPAQDPLQIPSRSVVVLLEP